MTNTYKQLASYMNFVANSAGMLFPTLADEDIADHIFASRNSVKGHMATFAKTEMNVEELTTEEYQALGFKLMGEEGDWAIPIWLFNLLPDGTKLYCPIDGSFVEVGDDTVNFKYKIDCVDYSLPLRRG